MNHSMVRSRLLNRINQAKNDLLLVKPLLASVLLLLTLYAGSARAEADDKIWQALQSGGHVALLRHALAPGTGDPAHFSLEDCTTQRNLSDAGEIQANNIGELLRNNGITEAQIYSSQWCRCMETARLLGFGSVQQLPALNSFFREFQRKQPQTEALLKWLTGQPLNTPTILVTHQVNITALTGVFPSSGELIVVKVVDGQVEVSGTVATPY